jgi:hypothetical protein
VDPSSCEFQLLHKRDFAWCGKESRIECLATKAVVPSGQIWDWAPTFQGRVCSMERFLGTRVLEQQ